MPSLPLNSSDINMIFAILKVRSTCLKENVPWKKSLVY